MPRASFIPRMRTGLSIATGHNYYFDATLGDDSNPGTLALPLKTVAKHNTMTFAAGDHVLWKCGETFAGELTPQSSGVAGNPIIYGAYSTGAAPIIDGSAHMALFIDYTSNPVHHLRFENLHFTGAANAADHQVVRAWSNDLYFYNCEVDDSPADLGASCWSPDGTLIYNITWDTCHFHNNARSGLYIGSTTAPGPHDCLVTGCESDHNGNVVTGVGNGIYVKYGCTVTGCTTHENIYEGGIKTNCEASLATIYFPVVYNNVSWGDKDGLYCACNGSKFYNNKVYDSVLASLLFDGLAQDSEIYFNTFINAKGNAAIVWGSFPASQIDNILKNNIVIQDAAVEAHYLIQASGASSLADFAANNTLDRNIYYYNGNTAAHAFYDGSTGAGKDWTEWQAYAGAPDPNSHYLAALPQFVARYTDLRPIQVGNISGEGVAITGYELDFNGETRANPPTPGYCIPAWSIKGNITNGTYPIPGVSVAITVPSGTYTGITDASGDYTIDGLATGDSGTLTPTIAGRTFTPATLAVTSMTSNITGKDFVGSTLPINLEVPIEMLQDGVRSLAAAGATVAYSRINFDISNYDGTPAAYFEIVARNNHAANAYDVKLIDITNADNVLATITVPANQTAYTRQRSTEITFAAGNNVLGLLFPQTEANGNIIVYAARIVILQTAPTKTRLQYSLCNRLFTEYDDSTANGYADSTTSETDAQGAPNNMGIYLKNVAALADIAAGTPWTLEAVLRNLVAGKTTTLTLYNLTSGNPVTGAVISTVGTTSALVSASFANNAVEFTDNNEFELRHKTTAAGTSRIANAFLYVTLDNLTKAEILYKFCCGWSGTTGTNAPYQRMLYDADSYRVETCYLEAVGYCADNANALQAREENSDSAGAGALIAGATINWNNAAKDRQRTAAITPTDGFRLYGYRIATTNTNVLTNMFLVLDVVAV